MGIRLAILSMSKDLLMIGAGGHASVLLEILEQQGANILGYVSPSPATNHRLFSKYNWFQVDDEIQNFPSDKVRLVNGIGSLPNSRRRAEVFRVYKNLGYTFETVISDHALISSHATLGEGVQIMSGAIVQTGVGVGSNSIINTGAILDHDCNVGSDNHIAPGVTLSGQVTSENNVHIGTGASVIQLIKISENSVVGAGAVVTRDVDRNTICYPARTFKKVISTYE